MGKYVAIVLQSDGRIVYYDASWGLLGPVAIADGSLAGSCLFSSPSRALFCFARADTGARKAARGAFFASLSSALTPLQPPAPAS